MWLLPSPAPRSSLLQSATRDPKNRVMGRGVYTSEGSVEIGFGTEVRVMVQVQGCFFAFEAEVAG